MIVFNLLGKVNDLANKFVISNKKFTYNSKSIGSVHVMEYDMIRVELIE